MTSAIAGLFSNPELIRNVRTELRMGRMLATAAVSVVISLVAIPSFIKLFSGAEKFDVWGMPYLKTILVMQSLVLILGGGLACLNAVAREKERNTFDFQRVTRLTPMELTLGKLFGAPAVAWFITLCFMPAALVGAVASRARPTIFLAALVLLVMSAVAFHALALMISQLLQRGVSGAALIVLLIFFPYFLMPTAGSAIFIIDLVEQTSWAAGPTDLFYGLRIHRMGLLLFIYLTVTAWFLLALVRNIKRDPAVYELYSPPQALGLALYVNFLVMGFINWKTEPPHDTLNVLLALNAFLLFLLGLALLRNRDRVRRRLRELGPRGTGWDSALWPGPYPVVAMLLVGLTVVIATQFVRPPKAEWLQAVALFQVVYLALWLVRDLLFLQWMTLRRSRRSLWLGLLYLVVYYASVTVVLSVMLSGSMPQNGYKAIMIPFPVFEITAAAWVGYRRVWFLALLAQVVVAGVFAFLHRQKLLALAPQPASDESASGGAPDLPGQ